jgi:hypothetical protein
VYIFNRRNGADELGHVGWAYDVLDGTFICGATENPKGLGGLGQTGDAKGWWVSRPYSNLLIDQFAHARVLPAGSCPPYDSYKVLDVAAPDKDRAWQVACWARDQPYELTGIPRGRNCMDDAYDILYAYGATNLPWPTTNPVPNFWYDAIPSPPLEVVPANLTVANPSNAKQDLAALPSSAPARPAWRTPGTPESARFNRHAVVQMRQV